MATRSRLDITPVFNHRKSIALVDTAETLVDSLDNLSVCLKHIDEKHVQNKNPSEVSKGEQSLYKKLKDNLEIAQDLTDTLKREKWRLSRRKMSVELRMGELEDYKSHLKRDMTDMNQTVESLSMRVIELEDALVEAQEIQELTEAERDVTQKRLDASEQTIKEMGETQTKMEKEIRQLKSQRKDSVLKRQHSEISDRIEILTLENKSLKDLIRDQDESGRTHIADANSQTNGLKDTESSVTNSGDVGNEGRREENGPKVPQSPVLTQTSEIAYV